MFEALVSRSIARPWLVILLALAVTVVAGWWTVTRFAITTDTVELIAADIPYRQEEVRFARAFPQNAGLVVAVVDAPSAEAADRASARLVAALRTRPDTFANVRRADRTAFLERNGLLLLPADDVARAAGALEAQGFLLNSLAADPTLRGLSATIGRLGGAISTGAAPPEALAGLAGGVAGTLEAARLGEAAPLSWQALLSGGEGPQGLEGGRRALVLANPVLDYGALEPGGAAIARLHQLADEAGVTEEGATLRLTGDVPLAGDEFSTVAENVELHSSLTVLAVALILFAALRSGRLILAVMLTLFSGLLVTAGLGLAIVGQLNLISVAFAVLFVGLGVDFGIQYTTRYREERHAGAELRPSLKLAARAIGLSLALAAASLVAGFFSFLPTHFRGVSELGLIAGLGMIVAFALNLTLLPALIAVLRPGPERAPVSTAGLASVDRWIERHRRLVIVGTFLLVAAGAPWLLRTAFDSNPMNLRAQSVESVATFLDLARDPQTAPNTINVLTPEAEIPELSRRLLALPEVDHVVSIASFVPADTAPKLAALRRAEATLAPAFAAQPPPAPSDAERVAALRQGAGALRQMAAMAGGGDASASAERMAAAMEGLAEADPAARERAEAAVFANWPTFLASVRAALSAGNVTRDTLPEALVRDWVAPDGTARIEVFPSGDSNDNATLQRFADAVRTVSTAASGPPIGITEAGATIVHAFLMAGLYALLAITLILWIALRRLVDVVMALGPLVIAGILTLETATLIGLPLNFANIIALPLMFGVGVAFHIYYLLAWRAGVADVLASSLTRAIFFSAITTGVAFGSLWASSHPGTSSMGQLLTVSLVWTLLAAFVAVPAFLGPPPKPGETR